MAKRDYYEILEVSKNVSIEGTKSAYRKLARKHLALLIDFRYILDQ